MIYTLVMSILLSLSFTLPLMMTPLTLGLWILLMALSTASFLTQLSSSWFGLILFIIYIGGMLVMFSYFAAITPNQKLSLFTLTLLFLLTNSILFYITNLSFNQIIITPASFISNTPLSFIYLLTPLQAPLLMVLASLLLLALIFVVKITNRNEGPLRPFI